MPSLLFMLEKSPSSTSSDASLIGVHPFFDFFLERTSRSRVYGKDRDLSKVRGVCARARIWTNVDNPGELPPLLPIFLHVYVPSLLRLIDGQVPSDQGLSVNFLGLL